MATNEKALVSDILNDLTGRWPDSWPFKVVGSPFQASGVPDILLVVDGHLFAFEVKHRKAGESDAHARGRASAQQLLQIERLNRAGATAHVILSSDEAIAIVENYLGAANVPGREL